MRTISPAPFWAGATPSPFFCRKAPVSLGRPAFFFARNAAERPAHRLFRFSGRRAGALPCGRMADRGSRTRYGSAFGQACALPFCAGGKLFSFRRSVFPRPCRAQKTAGRPFPAKTGNVRRKEEKASRGRAHMAEDSAFSDAGTRCFAVFQRGAEPDTVRLRLRGSLCVAVFVPEASFFLSEDQFFHAPAGHRRLQEGFFPQRRGTYGEKKKRPQEAVRTWRRIPPFLMPGSTVLPCFRGERLERRLSRRAGNSARSCPART